MTNFRKIWRVLLVTWAAILAAAIAYSSIGYWINGNVEARLLLSIRGKLPPPPHVKILSIDKLSLLRIRQKLSDKAPAAAWLNACLSPGDRKKMQLVSDLEDVPRGLYRCVLKRATTHSPAAIIFDISFNESRPDDDRFAATIREVGGVYLLVSIDAPDDETGLVIVKRPVPVLANAAEEIGHFRVGGAGLTRTYLPVTYTGIQALPVLLEGRPDAVPADDGDTLHFDFIGASGAVRTISIADLLLQDSPVIPVGGDVIFIGHSDADSIEKIDHFRTPADVFGDDLISGVELMATAYANLRDGQQKKQLGPAGVIGLSFGIAMAMSVIVTLRRWRRLLAMIALFCISAIATWGLYIAGLFAPVLTLFVVIVGTFEFWRITSTNIRLQAAIRKLLPRFAQDPFVERGALPTSTIRATVAFCDLVGSTSIAETVGADQFSNLVHRYYQLATECVESEGGDIVDFLGDGFIAIFRETTTGPSTSSRAFSSFDLFAAALAKLPVTDTDLKLRSRVGVCTGPVRAGAFGSDRRVKVTAMGDAMNTAARLEEHAKSIFVTLKKKPIVLVAADEATIEAQSDGAFQPVKQGPVKLRGKSIDTIVYSITFYGP